MNVCELTVTPLPNFTLAPLTKFAPMIWTCRFDAPRAPLLGTSDNTEGARSIVRQPEQTPLKGPGFVTVTSRPPIVAPLATAIVAVSWVELTKLTDFTVTPLPETDTVAPAAKFEPLTVTFAFAAPWPSALGFTDVTVGATTPAGICRHRWLALSYSR